MSRLKGAICAVAIALLSAILALLIVWRVPALEASAGDWLMRQRGLLPPPDDIVIVAIDEQSLQRFGRFPWPRSLMAQALDAIKNSNPKAIALDALYVDQTTRSDDAALASAVKRAGNVVVAAQLTAGATSEDAVEWLRPLPDIESNAAGVGHVDVNTGFDGVARTLLLRKADDQGVALWAIAVELVRVGAGLPAGAIRAVPDAVAVGERLLPVTRDPDSELIESMSIGTGGAAGSERLRVERLSFDYIGPAGSFAPQTISFGEIIDGRVDPRRLHDKYVLIGATAASLGEKVASPFIQSLSGGRLRGDLMPGVEVLANEVNAILRGRFYREVPDWIAFLCSFLVGAGVIIFAALAQGSYEIARQIAALGVLLALILFSSYLAFSRWLILPPVAPMIFAFTIATPLTLLWRALVLSREIDSRIAELSKAGQSLLPAAPVQTGTAGAEAGLIASVAKAAKAIGWKWRLPRGADWKARELKALNQQLLQRALFIGRALWSIEDGLIIAATDARIIFANPRAAQILGVSERTLAGGDLFERISEAEFLHFQQSPTIVSRLQSAEAAREALRRLLEERESIEREITLGGSAAQHYSLRVSTVADSAHGEVYGIVAVFTDITRHRELQRTQRDVMALVTHELKTPLTAIQGMSELLSQFEMDAARRREMHLIINDEAKRLARMIDEYLDLTRLESGARQLRLAPLRIEQLMERALLLLDPVAERAGVKIVRNLSPDLPPILGDADLIGRAVTNLVDNAVKFSPANSTVTVNARSEGPAVLIEVIDQGCGVAPEFLPHIFEKFYRVPRAANADVPGAGLGLSLVREVAELHDGMATVESQPGKGSIFTLY
ncbi:MAG TPA: CHASE2 domain-containing protein, partial [Blastocatellia bacterium]|nr:CHASE2 domain-containing protein [Blastocatellia bacterium]